MIKKQIICDRCKKVALDSERIPSGKVQELVDAMFKGTMTESLGYVEINVNRFDGAITRTIHLCGDCYDIAVKALNEVIQTS